MGEGFKASLFFSSPSLSSHHTARNRQIVFAHWLQCISRHHLAQYLDICDKPKVHLGLIPCKHVIRKISIFHTLISALVLGLVHSPQAEASHRVTFLLLLRFSVLLVSYRRRICCLTHISVVKSITQFMVFTAKSEKCVKGDTAATMTRIAKTKQMLVSVCSFLAAHPTHCAMKGNKDLKCLFNATACLVFCVKKKI